MKATATREDQVSQQKANKEDAPLQKMGSGSGNSKTPPAFQLKAGPPIQREEAPVKDKWADVKAVLEQCDTGKEALKRMTDHSITVEFKAGGGSYYSAGKMIIDDAHSAERAALTFVHEMNHAHYDKEGLGADVSKETKEEYVKKMVAEEAEGVVKSIEAKVELEGTKVNLTGLSYPLETEYRKAYKKSYDASIAAKKSEEIAKAEARIAGTARVTKGFVDGEVVTSTDKKSYPTYYGEYWDRVHPSKK